MIPAIMNLFFLIGEGFLHTVEIWKRKLDMSKQTMIKVLSQIRRIQTPGDY